MSCPVIQRAKQDHRGGTAGCIRVYHAGRVVGADTITPRTSPPIPDYLRPGIPFDDNLEVYLAKAATTQAQPSLPPSILNQQRGVRLPTACIR